MGCCMRNCYGTSTEDLIKQTKNNLPLECINFLLDLSKCTNSQSQRNGLANFNALNIFAASSLIKRINEMDRNGDRYDLSTVNKNISSQLPNIMSDFDELTCSGRGQELIDLDNKYNSGNGGNGSNMFPPELSDADKDKILELLDKNNNYNDSMLSGGSGGKGNNGSSGGNGIGTGNGSTSSGSGSNNSGNGGSLGNNNLNNTAIIKDSSLNNGDNKDTIYDDTFSNSGNVLVNIPDDELTKLEYTKKFFTCFKPVFDVNDYLFLDKRERPLLTSDKIKNLKRVHNELLLPIYNHYYGVDSNPSCQIKIIFALGSLKNTIVDAGGSSFSRHLRGEAVDFTMVGVSAEKLINDLKSGVLRLNFGVLAATNGTHLTLPYTFEDLDVRGMILSSPKQSTNSLNIEFIF